jgi:hypothetical protein
LNYNGSPVVTSEFSGWTPIGGEQTSTGYDVAWKNAAANQYVVWTTDSSGNFLSSTGGISGTSTTLENFEVTTHQDLNGDGIIGPPPPTVIESFGITSLVQVGNNYFLNLVAGGTGPELNYNGSPVVTGEFSGWTPIGGEQTSTGYDVAWKNAAANQYAVWTTDSSSNFISSTGGISGTSTTLERFEVAMHQDLNGDGVIGIPSLTKPATVSSSQDNFQFAGNVNSGMVVQAPAGQTGLVTITSHDTFVFAPNFGQVTITNFAPATDTIEFSKTVFANINALLAATHDDASGNAVMTDAAHDTITLKHVTTAQVLAHQNDFHFV